MINGDPRDIGIILAEANQIAQKRQSWKSVRALCRVTGTGVSKVMYVIGLNSFHNDIIFILYFIVGTYSIH